MIFGNLSHRSDYSFLGSAVLECFRYITSHDLSAYEPGSHPIDGDRLYVNIAEYETTDAQSHFWEAHRKYLDLHFMISGCERIDLAFIENMRQKDYVPQEDFLPLDGTPAASVVLHENDFLLCFPKDGHMTGLAGSKPCKLKKAIFKIRIDS